MALRVLAAGLLLAGLSACAGGQAKPSHVGAITGALAWSPDGRQIAWNEDSRIWTARPDMSEPHAITPTIDDLGSIAWVTARRLVYWANFRLFSVSPGRTSSLISVGGDSDFSADGSGTRIATGDPPCSTGCDGPVVVMELGGRVVARISPHTQNLGPSLTRNGERIAFARNVCDRNGRCDRATGIWTATVPRGTLRQVAPPGCCPTLSPDGTGIVYVDTRYGRGRAGSSLRLLSATGRVRRGRVLARLGGRFVLPPVWSPDSRSIAVVDDKGRLLILNPSRGGIRAATGGAVGVVIGFAWSRDSSRLLVAARPSPHACSSLWLVNGKTAAVRVLRRCG